MNHAINHTQRLLALRDQHVSRGIVTAHPVVAARAQGAELWDVDGTRYLDFVGGIGVLNTGHSHPAVVEAVRRQAGEISHASFQVVAYENYIELAARLNALIGAGEHYKSVLFTSGAEAVENAIKIARGHTGRPAVISFRGGFHGRTLLGVTLTGMSQPYKQNFGPFPAEIYHSVYPNAYRGISAEQALAELDELFATDVAADRVAAILVEPVQGDGGFLPAPAAFLQGLRERCTRHGIVLILDEIQAGFGRTGKMFGFQHAGIQPDLVTVAKSLAGGMPLSGVVGRADIMDAPLPGGLGGTYGGNAVACAAALAVLELFEHTDLLAQGERLAVRLQAGLLALQARHPRIGQVRGLGFMQAIEMVTGDGSGAPDAALAQAVIDAARAAGLLVIKCGVQRNVVRFLAPLVTTEAQLDEALGMLAEALASTC
ncbi:MULTISPECIES: 4-aminobutyrate--2-oxoglutarate transaminase [unclassified Pseudomonas]|uniref:4-aminobutyrate--2-oxoglutarate transaminase n=1 Tax=unclassified Pseudomonas TaxID=196821 RepID=UPI000BC597AB|nr:MULTISPECIES: 4-aminobutyrate--2-oxoglutarate transaminase [unclassified Pseudomonas]PVZ19699.1 4-aminobutyrate aminotransferase/(S)-3-amino-2-methylpropionate transaminase [Pseudomonas sp. URIL14HWK12:I12]PVZ22716.1 4-aminobutyrate aminotransferase/(S)-3-amino-2-methylpropionate transaminase [Pseudomonas sp. URIL14HWK12:I10]PVZ37654.1 4-aminobutyrate aminotransferase/(S)-3-amino-2-methylpropionate transaminase [Pseudomonas sp. URIL14HWK12:I11]SNZ15399.1 4-aminobutyrate aminotransferase / (S